MPNSSTRRFARVIVIGLDGLEPTIAEPMLRAGELPNLSRLSAAGGYSRIQTTYPAQTPVAWSTFATGVNPGGHGIFDFVRRDPKTYLPDLGLTRYEQKNAFVPPRAVNLRRGKPMWDTLSAHAITSVILRCPCTYPPDAARGKMLSGLGVPDIRGGFGTGTFYCDAPAQKQQENEQLIHLDFSGGNKAATYLPGPLDRKTRAPHQLPLTIETRPADRQALVQVEGAPPVLLSEGRWSGWVPARCKVGFMQAAAGLVRFYLVRQEPSFELYASPVHFDPREPLFPISSPAAYSNDLAQEMGLYATAGMVEDHNALNNGRLSEAAFLEQCDQVWKERERMMLLELARFKDGLFYCLFDTPDRVQHMFWRFREPSHPANAGRPALPEYARVIEDHYRRADAAVGRAMDHADDRTLFIVLSDHGFNSFERGVNLNTWLHRQGLLALKEGMSPGPGCGDMLRAVDWSRTQAYATGLTGIYLNLRGRERDGMVSPDEAESVKQAICRGLTGLVDPARGTVGVTSALPREQVFQGPFVGEAPDVIVNFAPKYRMSWTTALGGVGEQEFEDNTRPWSGDHIIDPTEVPGVLWMNHPFSAGARLLDMAPTILAALGVQPPPEMEGASLLQ